MKSRSIFLFLASNALAAALSAQTVYKDFPSYLVDPVKAPAESSFNPAGDPAKNGVSVTLENPFAPNAPAYDAVSAANAAAKLKAANSPQNARVYRKRRKNK